ncbi:MAG TPA: YciI family protein [Ideonella sp.]|jgi:hypothetical protein|nr:YciI family protein [Ideonella sp.]
MSPNDAPQYDYLVLSRGQWDSSLPKETIQRAIDDFYIWYELHLGHGQMKPGQRLKPERRSVSKHGVTDGPFAEAKEVIGGYWFIVASSLEQAATIAAGNPCLACGLELEIREVDPERASAWAVTNETPPEFRA